MGGIVAGAIFLIAVFNPMPSSEPSPHLSSPPPKAPTQTPKPPSPTPSEIIHKVENGDTLYTIAEKYYGGEKYWINLWNNNDWIEDPRFIKSGWELKIANSKPREVEEPSPKLAAIYEEIVNPSPTPTEEPTKEVAGLSTEAQGTPNSFDDVYRQAGAKYAVPWEILYGLHVMETGGRDGAISSGYGTGAQGPLQFMPATWAIYGVDGNGDGAIDINNAWDAIFGAANYIASHGGVEQGLKSYGGDTQTALNAARSRGYSQ